MRVLLVEDDKALGMFLKRGLQQEGHEVIWAQNGEDGLLQAMTGAPDLLVLDLSLPRMDGADLLQKVHAVAPDTAIVVLTGRVQLEERIRCLNMGADDFLLKPFSFSELVARCRAVLRRRLRMADASLRCGDIEVDRIKREVKLRQTPVELTAKEYALLEHLLIHQGKAISRTQLLQEVWHTTSYTGTNVVDVYINYLRKKLCADGEHLIETVRGQGYKLVSRPAIPASRASTSDLLMMRSAS